MMYKEILFKGIQDVFEQCPGNLISKQEADYPEVAGIELFEFPLIGIASAEDVLFSEFKTKEIIGPWHMLPTEWLASAKTVVSLFFPFTEAVKNGNRQCKEGPSPAWLYGRVEGQAYLNSYTTMFGKWLTAQGIQNCAPSIDPRFRQIVAGKNADEYDCVDADTFASNWSERHAAYVCGLGTFGLSKGIITEKGMAGRFTSIIIDTEIPPNLRSYTEIYEYCTQCGACIKRCPANAISAEHGKNHKICSEWLNKMSQLHAPRYGCGLCQTKIPCESKRPKQQ